MVDSAKIKETLIILGADLCGIAPVERFAAAPEGFKPTDIFNECKSVIVYAKQVPKDSLYASSCVPYTHIGNIITYEVDRMGIEIAIVLEEWGIKAVPVPSDDPYEHWEPERSYGRAILSLRHAGYLAGLGVLGRNTLLINEKYGNMIQIGAVLVDITLDGDDIAEYNVCKPDCDLCITNCPQNALDGITVNQELCRPLSNYKTEKGYVLKKCNLCRRICPYSLRIV